MSIKRSLLSLIAILIINTVIFATGVSSRAIANHAASVEGNGSLSGGVYVGDPVLSKKNEIALGLPQQKDDLLEQNFNIIETDYDTDSTSKKNPLNITKTYSDVTTTQKNPSFHAVGAKMHASN